MIPLPLLQDSTCGKCIALCCQYITVEIDKPRTKRQKDDVRWYLLHQGISLLIEPTRWLIKVNTRCAALGDSNECTIYDRRPQICRDYKNDNCDYFTEYEGWDHDYIEIESAEAFEKYLAGRKRKPKIAKTNGRVK